ncbi:hypothetical protein ACLOJK_013025 [Asimina triloba]
MTEYDPRLVAPTCLTEKYGVPSAKIFISSMAICMEDIVLSVYLAGNSDEKYRFEIKDILEMEMKLLEALDYYLVIYHPYRPLCQLIWDVHRPRKLSKRLYSFLIEENLKFSDRYLHDAGLTDLTQLSWYLVNDTYRMDLILVYPPYMIALACIYIATALKDKDATALKDKDATAWFEELRVDMNVVKNISMEILDFYDSYKHPSEERINAALNKLALKA